MKADRIGEGIAQLNRYDGAGHKSGILHELQKCRGLVDHAQDPQRRLQGAVIEIGQWRLMQIALARGDRVAVGIGVGVAQQGVDAVEDFVGDDALQLLGLGVDFGPIKLEHANKEKFHQPVPAENVEGELRAGGGEAHAATRLGKWMSGWFLLACGWTSAVLITAMDIYGLPGAVRDAWKVIVGH